MNESPRRDRGNDRRRPSHRPTTEEPTVWGDRFRTRSFSPERQTAFGKSHGLVVCKCRLEALRGLGSADLTSEAAETLRSARTGGGPSGEAAVTRDRRDRERHAVRSRGGGGAESAGWREVAEWCHAAGGSDHE